MSAAKIVLIEDNPADVFLVEMALKESGILYEMTRFENGEDAVASLCAADGCAADGSSPDGSSPNSLHPDLILLDLNTPKSDGFEVLEKLRQAPHLVGVPIGIVTSSQAESDKQRVGMIGRIRYIEKPSQLDEFLTTVGQAIKEMLSRGSPLPL